MSEEPEDHRPGDENQNTLQSLADEVDDALRHGNLDLEGAKCLYDMLAGIAAGAADRPVEDDFVEFFRELIHRVINSPRLHKPEEGQGAA